MTNAPSKPIPDWRLGTAAKKRSAAKNHRLLADQLDREAEALDEARRAEAYENA
jgi:hypothetical protein